MVSQTTSVSIVYSTICSGADEKKTSKLRVTGLCEGNSSVTGGFPAHRANNAENVSILMTSSWALGQSYEATQKDENDIYETNFNHNKC